MERRTSEEESTVSHLQDHTYSKKPCDELEGKEVKENSATNSPKSLFCYACKDWIDVTEIDRLPHLLECEHQYRTNCSFVCKSCNKKIFGSSNVKFMVDEIDEVVMLQTILLSTRQDGLLLSNIMDIIKNTRHLSVFDKHHFAKKNDYWDDRARWFLEVSGEFFELRYEEGSPVSDILYLSAILPEIGTWHLIDAEEALHKPAFALDLRKKHPRVSNPDYVVKFDERTTDGPTMALFQPLVDTNIKAVKLNNPSQQSWQLNSSPSSSGSVIGSFPFTIGVIYFEVELVSIAEGSVVSIGIAPEEMSETCSSTELKESGAVHCFTHLFHTCTSSVKTGTSKADNIVGCLVEFPSETEEKKDGEDEIIVSDKHRTVTFFLGDKEPLVLTDIPVRSYSLAVHLNGEAEVIVNFGPRFNSLPEKARTTWVPRSSEKIAAFETSQRRMQQQQRNMPHAWRGVSTQTAVTVGSAGKFENGEKME